MQKRCAKPSHLLHPLEETPGGLRGFKRRKSLPLALLAIERIGEVRKMLRVLSALQKTRGILMICKKNGAAHVECLAEKGKLSVVGCELPEVSPVHGCSEIRSLTPQMGEVRVE